MLSLGVTDDDYHMGEEITYINELEDVTAEEF